MERTRRPQGGRPPGIEIRNREQLRYDVARIGDRTTLARRLRKAIEDDEQRASRKYPYLPQAATIWDWLDKGKPVAWPGHALRDLAQFIRDQTGKPCDRDAWIHPPATALHVCNAPRRPSVAFRGRESELEELQAVLVGGENVSVSAAIEGLPGIGKTELALQIAHSFAAQAAQADQAPAFPRGIFWFNAENRDLAPGWDEVARKCLNIEADTPAARVAEAIRRIEGSPEPSLLILDNVFLDKDERWAEGEGKPGPLPDGPQIRLLVTTRNDYLGGTAFRRRRLGTLPDDAARELLLEISGRGDAAAARLDGLDELLEELAGHALAVEICGVYLQKNGHETPRSLLERLVRGDRFERQARQTAYAVQKSDYEATIGGAFAALWNSLDDATRAQWRLAAQFEPYPVSVELSAAAGLDADALEGLRDFHLIEWDQRGASWIMHRLTRAFGRAGSTEEDRAALQSFLQGCSARAAELDRQRNVPAVLIDRPHFERALELAPEHLEPAAELAILLASATAFIGSEGLEAGSRLYRRAIEVAERSGRHAELARALDSLLVSSSMRGDHARAEEIARHIDELAQRYPTGHLALNSYRQVGDRNLIRGAFAEAWRWYEKAIELYRAAPKAELVRNVFHPSLLFVMSGMVRAPLGEPESALQLCSEGLKLATEAGDPVSLSTARLMASMVHSVCEQFAEAEAEVLRTVDREDTSLLGDITGFQEAVYRARGAPELAGELAPVARGCLDRMAERGLLLFHPGRLQMYAEICVLAGRRETALAALDESLRLIEKTGERIHEFQIRMYCAEIAEQPAERCQLLEEAIAVARKQNARWFVLQGTEALLRAADTPELRARAEQELREICAELREGFDLPPFQRARAALGIEPPASR